MSSTPVAAASVGSPGAADGVRQLFGDRPSPISPPSSGLPAPPTAPTARPEPMRSNIATPASADRILQLTAQMAEMMMAMQSMMDEVKRLTAGGVEGVSETVHARDASALRQPGETLSPGVVRTEATLTELDPLQQAGRAFG